MPTGISVLLILLIGVFVIFYKRKMLIKMFSINIATMADEFRIEMETTAEKAVKRLEQQMAQLEYLLDEADAKILALEERLIRAENSAQSDLSPSTELKESKAAIPGPINQAHLINESIPQQQGNYQPTTQANGLLQNLAPDKREQVITMHRQGYNVVQIAKATAMGKGEVMLLLELYKS